LITYSLNGKINARQERRAQIMALASRARKACEI
jgi:hypothetical protein